MNRARRETNFLDAPAAPRRLEKGTSAIPALVGRLQVLPPLPPPPRSWILEEFELSRGDDCDGREGDLEGSAQKKRLACLKRVSGSVFSTCHGLVWFFLAAFCDRKPRETGKRVVDDTAGMPRQLNRKFRKMRFTTTSSQSPK